MGTEQKIYNETTTEAALNVVSNADPLPIILQNDNNDKLFQTEAVISESKPALQLDDNKEFLHTTTLAPVTTNSNTEITTALDNFDEPKFELEAIVAEEENN